MIQGENGNNPAQQALPGVGSSPEGQPEPGESKNQDDPDSHLDRDQKNMSARSDAADLPEDEIEVSLPPDADKFHFGTTVLTTAEEMFVIRSGPQQPKDTVFPKTVNNTNKARSFSSQFQE